MQEYSKDINILAIDLSTDCCSAALLYDGEIFQQSIVSNLRSQKILALIDKLLLAVDCKPEDLTSLAFGAGPGSFTGLKVASSVIQGLSLAWQKPIIKISTLWALALQGYLQYNNIKYILPCMDAKMNQVYYELYAIKESPFNNMPVIIEPDCISNIQNINLSTINNDKLLIVGDGSALFSSTSLLKNVIVDEEIKYIYATSIVKLALFWYKNNINNYQLDNNNGEPIYLKSYI